MKITKHITLHFAIAIIVLLFASCKPLPIRESHSVSNEEEIIRKSSEIPFSWYHADSKIRYDIYHTEEALYLRFDVSDRNTIHKIFTYGLEIYVDTVGKRKKHEGFIYPTPEAVKQSTVLQPQIAPNLPDKNEINELQKRVSPTIILIHNNEETHDNVFSKESKIEIKMSLSKDGNLAYQAKIPLEEFGLKQYNDVFTIGILTGDLPEKEDLEDKENVNIQNGGVNNYYGNNTAYQPGYQSRVGASQQAAQNNYNKALEPVSLWFKVQLNSANKEND